jgi:hypothetical protein
MHYSRRIDPHSIATNVSQSFPDGTNLFLVQKDFPQVGTIQQEGQITEKFETGE